MCEPTVIPVFLTVAVNRPAVPVALSRLRTLQRILETVTVCQRIAFYDTAARKTDKARLQILQQLKQILSEHAFYRIGRHHRDKIKLGNSRFLH